MSQLIEILKEKFEVKEEKKTTEYYLTLNAKEYVGIMNLSEGSEDNEAFISELNEFLKREYNLKAIFAKINIYLMPI